jgi:hypothetical protein
VRQTLDSLSRLAAQDDGGVAPQDHADGNLDDLVERLIECFDDEPETKTRVAKTLKEMA